MLSTSTAPPIEPSVGKFITTQSLHLNVDIRVPRLPREGNYLQAKSAESSPGGGYIGAAAARAQGVVTWCASPLGTGPNSHAIRRRMVLDGIETPNGVVVGDVGVGVSLVEEDGKMAAVVATGVEVETSIQLLNSVPVQGSDIVLIHGGDLAVPSSAEVLSEWVRSLPSSVRVVVAVSPAVEQVPAAVWMPILGRANIVTMNIREADAIRETILGSHPGITLREVLGPNAAVVRRLGPMGCDLQKSVGAPTVQLRPFKVDMVDTAGVGDTHVAVMCAALLHGFDIDTACLRANAAGALMVEHPGSFPPPTKQQVDDLMKELAEQR